MQNPNERFSGVDTWTGVQASYRNIKPKHTLYYNPIFMKNGTLKIDAIINWLTNSSTPANCIFSYFDEPDYTSHNYGSFNNETLGKVKQIDKIVGYLIQKLNQTNLLNKTNLILLSDHGMTDIM